MIRMAGRTVAWREGMTVADLLRELNDPYPYAVVRVNDTTVIGPGFEQALVPDDAEVYLIPMVAGG